MRGRLGIKIAHPLLLTLSEQHGAARCGYARAFHHRHAQSPCPPTGENTQARYPKMNSNGDGTVDSAEFLKFETAFVAAEKAGS